MKKSVKLFSLLLTVLMIAGVFAAVPLTAEAAPADEAVGDALSNFDALRNYIENCYDGIEPDGRYISRYWTDSSGGTVSFYLTHHENNALTLEMYYNINGTKTVVKIKNFNFRSSYNINPEVIYSENGSMEDFKSTINPVDARTYNPSTAYTVTITYSDGLYSNSAVAAKSRECLKQALNCFDAVLLTTIGLHLGDIGFGYYSKTTVPASGIKLNTTVLTITEGNKYTLKATITPSDTTDKTVYWSSSDPTVAGMASGGVLTAKKAGTCVITAKTHNGYKTTCNVTVKAKSADVPTGITVSPTALTMTAGTKYTLKANITPSTTASKTVYWSSSNPSVAGMGSGGVVNAKTAGNCVITAKTSNGISAKCTVTVKPAITGITVSPTTLTMTAGTKYTLKATITPSAVLSKTVYWSSSDPNVAGMASGGVVNAKAAGTCTVTAKTSNGKTATCKVTVKGNSNGPTGIKLNFSSVTMTEGTKFTLKATVIPDTAKNKTVYWSSSDPTIAGMQSGGVIIAKIPGTCTITAKTSNGFSASCKVTVRSIEQRNIDNFKKLKNYVETKGATDEGGNKVISKIYGDDGIQMYMYTTSSGGLQLMHIDTRDTVIDYTVLSWNLPVNKSASAVVKQYTSNYGSLKFSSNATFNIGLYDGDNASFSSHSVDSHACLNDAIYWLNNWMKSLMGFGTRELGFSSFYL